MSAALLSGVLVGGAACAEDPTACAAPGGAWPTFCSIPRVPATVRKAAQFHDVVLDTRLAGRALERETEPSRFTLENTSGFAARAMTEAAPPPPVTSPGEADTDAFLRDAKARATPPKHPR